MSFFSVSPSTLSKLIANNKLLRCICFCIWHFKLVTKQTKNSYHHVIVLVAFNGFRHYVFDGAHRDFLRSLCR